jgi:hypothetical protein
MDTRNPFLLTSPIELDADFIGREPDLRRLFEVVSGPQPQSISIYGERRIGKSSLLRAFERRAPSMLSPADRYLVLRYEIAEASTPGELVLQLIERVSGATKQSPAMTTSTTALTDLIESVAAADKRLVVLMDDFDEIVSNRDFPVDIFNFLRSLVSHQPVSMVLTSRRRLIDVCHEKVRGSPFFNVFHERRLDVFSDREAAHLIARGAASGVPLAPYERWIRASAGTFPLYLQIACALAFEAAREAPGIVPTDNDLARLSMHFAEQVEPHFSKLWSRFADAERETLIQLAAPARTRMRQDVLQALARRGYVTGADHRFFSERFAEFVRGRAGDQSATPCECPVEQSPPALKLFVSYAREDKEFLEEQSLLGYLSGLQNHGVSFWDDRQIPAGADWKTSIVTELERADLALLLVSQYWLNSPFVLDEEVSRIMRRRAAGELHVVPVLIGPCMWETDPWVSTLQLLPPGATPLSALGSDRGAREAAYLSVLRALRATADRLRPARAHNGAAMATAAN